MNAFKNTAVRTARLTCAVILLSSATNAIAQNATGSQESKIPNAWMAPDQIKTLDNVRRLNEFGPYGDADYIDENFDYGIMPMEEMPDMSIELPDLNKELPNFRDLQRDSVIKCMRSLRDAIQTSSGKRPTLEAELKDALAEYFIADIRCRVHELDEIKAKVAETEAKLQKRLDSQQDAVDLQLRIMLRDADGFGFFHKDGDADRISNPGPDMSGSTKPIPPIKKE